MVPVTNPNERRSRACSSAKAPPTLAGRGRGPAQSSARSPAISRNAPGAPGPGRGPPLERGNSPIRASWQRTGRPSRRRLGADSRPPRIVRHSPPGGPKLEVQHGPAPSQAPGRWQWMRHSGRCTRTLECTEHCPDTTDPWDQSNAEPPLTPSPERVPRIAHAALGCAILVQGECSRSTGRHAREPPLVRAVVVVSSDGSTQV